MGVGTTLGGECCASENKLKLQNACVIILENKEGLAAQTYREDKYGLSSLTAHVGESVHSATVDHQSLDAWAADLFFLSTIVTGAYITNITE